MWWRRNGIRILASGVVIARNDVLAIVLPNGRKMAVSVSHQGFKGFRIRLHRMIASMARWLCMSGDLPPEKRITE